MFEGRFRQIAEDVIEMTVASSQMAQQFADTLRRDPFFNEVVPGLASIAVSFDPISTSVDEVIAALEQAEVSAPERIEMQLPVLRIPLRYGGESGPDLQYICEDLGIEKQDFIDRHVSAVHRVDMIGFMPGFAYVSGIDPSFSISRRPAPRPRLPAGSIGISGNYTGLYALAGPGGWPIIGKTDLSLFDPDADDPFLLQPGQRIKFEAV